MVAENGAIFKDCVSTIGCGSHVCNIYRNKKEQLEVALPYVVAGLEDNQRCFYVADKEGREDIRYALRKAGIDVNGCIGKGQLIITGKEETYLRDGFFSPIAILDMALTAYYEALRDGYSGLRGSGDLNLSDRDGYIFNDLIDYEREVNYLFWHSHIIGLCQYYEASVPEDVLLKVLYTHPKAVIYGRLYENPFYIPPTIFNKQSDRAYPQGVYHKVRDKLITP